MPAAAYEGGRKEIKMFQLTEENGRAALLGGWFLGGGGGGLPEGGEATLEEALSIGPVNFLSIDELRDEEIILTASLVGSPASKDSCIARQHYEQVYRQFCAAWSGEVAALTTNETGAQSISNGWITAALTGLPMVDGACNGRAHPTGLMGAMGLDQLADYRAVQAGAGGVGAHHTELCAVGTVGSTSQLIRQAAPLAGGFVTVLRNPVTAAYYRENAALGAVTQVIELGRLWQAHDQSAESLLRMLQEQMECRVLAKGRISRVELKMTGGFDVGSLTVENDGPPLEIDFMNEYLLAEQSGRRLATFPELIAVIDLASRRPVCSAQLRKGAEVAVVALPVRRLTLGRGMKIPQLFTVCEEALGKPLCSYAFSQV